MAVWLHPDTAPTTLFCVNLESGWKKFIGIVNTAVTEKQAVYFTDTGNGYVDFSGFTVA